MKPEHCAIAEQKIREILPQIETRFSKEKLEWAYRFGLQSQYNDDEILEYMVDHRAPIRLGDFLEAFEIFYNANKHIFCADFHQMYFVICKQWEHGKVFSEQSDLVKMQLSSFFRPES